MVRITLVFLLCANVIVASAQTARPQCLLFGYVEEGTIAEGNPEEDPHQLPNRLSGVTIYLHDQDSLLLTRMGRETGFYALILEGGKKYRVTYEKEGYFCKTFEFDLLELIETSEGDALKCAVDVELFPTVDHTELRELSTEIFARSAFQPANKQLVWDKDYIQQQRQRFFAMAQTFNLADRK